MNHFASLLKKYKIVNYKIISNNNKHRDAIVVFNIDDGCYYKFFYNYTEDIQKYDHVFLNTVCFPNHKVHSIIDDAWIVKQTVPKGIILSNILNKTDVPYKKIIDSILTNMLWVHNESNRIFLDKPENKYWDFANGDIGENNIIYDEYTNTAINIDIEPASWFNKEEFTSRMFDRFRYNFKNWNVPDNEINKFLKYSMEYIQVNITHSKIKNLKYWKELAKIHGRL